MFCLWSHGVLADKDAPAFIHTPCIGHWAVGPQSCRCACVGGSWLSLLAMQTEVPGRIWPFSLAQNLHHKAELLFFTKKLSAKFDIVIGSIAACWDCLGWVFVIWADWNKLLLFHYQFQYLIYMNFLAWLLQETRPRRLSCLCLSICPTVTLSGFWIQLFIWVKSDGE